MRIRELESEKKEFEQDMIDKWLNAKNTKTEQFWKSTIEYAIELKQKEWS